MDAGNFRDRGGLLYSSGSIIIFDDDWNRLHKLGKPGAKLIDILIGLL